MAKPKHVVPADLVGAIPGGCPCGFWSKFNCAYLQAMHMCRSAERPVRALTAEDQS